MGLHVILQIDKKELLIGENPVCTLTLENSGPQAVDVAHPDYGSGMLTFRSVRLLSGDEVLSRGEVAVRGDKFEMVRLGSGDKIQTFISLTDKVSLNIPGDYAVSAIYNIPDGREPVESNVVRIKLRHFSVNNPYLPAVTTTNIPAVFVDPSVKPPEIIMARFIVADGGGLYGIRSIAETRLGARPFLSLPPNGNWADHRWFAWLEDDIFRAVFLDGLTEKSAETQLRLEAGRAEIIPPLAIAAGDSGSASGAALVWLEEKGKAGATVRRIDLTLNEGGVSAVGSWKYRITGERPSWMMSYLPSNGDRLFTFIRSDIGGQGLYLLPWPKENMSPVSLKKVIDWPRDEYVAAGAVLNEEDEIRGATLVWNSSEGKKVLELVTWKVNAGGNGEELERDVLPWSPMMAIGKAIVRVRQDGVAAVLMRSDDYNWSVWDGEKKSLNDVPEPYTKTKKSINIAFKDQEEIVLICADFPAGLVIKRMDGSDLPPAFPE